MALNNFLIFSIFFVTFTSLGHSYPQQISKNYQEVFDTLKKFDVWKGPAIPSFFDPQRYQNLHTIDPAAANDVKTFTIQQSLDNFDLKNVKTFGWRYHENNKYYKAGGPILIWVGGEWPTLPEEIGDGTYYAELAQKFNATLFYTEHRYYGKSHPFPDLSTENLEFLSIEQGMADLASFINYIKTKRSELKNAKVVLIGGSYTGALVSWFRVKYPDLVAGAWSSSGVIDTRADFSIYKVIAGEDYRKAGGDKCYDAIKSTFTQLEQWADEKRGDLIEEHFKFCRPLNYENTLDVQAFFNVLGWNLAEINQIMRKNETEAVCNFILDETVNETPLHAIAAIFRILNENCVPGSFEDLENYLNTTEIVPWPTSTDETRPASAAYRQWFYQLCTGMGLFWTTSSPNQPFGTKVPVEYWTTLCTRVFKKTFTPTSVETAAKALRDKYGGKDTAKFTKVYSSHGTLDPWRGGGVEKDVDPTSPTYIIDDAGHCFDINIYYRDLTEVVTSQSKAEEIIEKWVKGSGANHKPFIFMVLGSLVFILFNKM